MNNEITNEIINELSKIFDEVKNIKDINSYLQFRSEAKKIKKQILDTVNSEFDELSLAYDNDIKNTQDSKTKTELVKEKENIKLKRKNIVNAINNFYNNKLKEFDKNFEIKDVRDFYHLYTQNRLGEAVKKTEEALEKTEKELEKIPPKYKIGSAPFTFPATSPKAIYEITGAVSQIPSIISKELEEKDRKKGITSKVAGFVGKGLTERELPEWKSSIWHTPLNLGGDVLEILGAIPSIPHALLFYPLELPTLLKTSWFTEKFHRGMSPSQQKDFLEKVNKIVFSGKDDTEKQKELEDLLSKNYTFKDFVKKGLNLANPKWWYEYFKERPLYAYFDYLGIKGMLRGASKLGKLSKSRRDVKK